jgi:LSD1 subclass zinc finger protein
MLGRTTDASKIMCACCESVNMQIVALVAARDVPQNSRARAPTLYSLSSKNCSTLARISGALFDS